MKLLLPAALLLGLASCSGLATDKATATPPAEDPTRAAVAAHLKKTLDDPASYQPARWGKEKPFTQRDVNMEKAGDYLLQYRHQSELGRAASQHYINLSDVSPTPKEGLAQLDKAQRILAVFKRRADSIMALSNKAKASADSTRLGTVVVHAYRAKNKMGALQLDSATFTVLKTGEVQMQKY